MEEIDVEGLAANKQQAETKPEKVRVTPVWEREDAPKGSTRASLMVFDRGQAVRVHGPTHYHHLADGRVTVGYSGGTHHSEPGEDGQDKVTRILAIHEG